MEHYMRTLSLTEEELSNMHMQEPDEVQKLDLDLESGGDSSGRYKVVEVEFWKEMFAVRVDFRLSDVKLLAATDVIESLQMRLTYFFDNHAFLETSQEHCISFGPFAGGLSTLSYQGLLWTLHGLSDDAPYDMHRAWCCHALNHAETMYLDDITARGYVLHPEDKKQLRADLTLYLTKLKKTSTSNDITYVSSNPFKQIIHRPSDAPAVGINPRALLAVPVDHMSRTAKRDLLAMLQNLSNTDKLPGGFDALRVAFTLQIFFLKEALEQWQPKPFMGAVEGKPPESYPPNFLDQ